MDADVTSSTSPFRQTMRSYEGLAKAGTCDGSRSHTFSRRENMSSMVDCLAACTVRGHEDNTHVCQPPPYTVSRRVVTLAAATLTTVSVIYGTGLHALGEPLEGFGAARGSPEKLLALSRATLPSVGTVRGRMAAICRG